jgi:hypothetical protein
MRPLEGGCSCGAVRFSLKRPLFVLACHCNPCKKRTGSAYGISVAVYDEAVERFEGVTTIFSRLGDSGKKVDYEFCPSCGTTIRWRVEYISNRQVFAGGALDDPKRIEIGGEMYTTDALPWARLGCELSRPSKPDDAFRSELIKRAQLSF